MTLNFSHKRPKKKSVGITPNNNVRGVTMKGIKLLGKQKKKKKRKRKEKECERYRGYKGSKRERMEKRDAPFLKAKAPADFRDLYNLPTSSSTHFASPRRGRGRGRTTHETKGWEEKP
jgi:hypothetical protein